MTGYVTEERNRRETVTNDAGAQTDFADEHNLPDAEEQDTFQKSNQRTLTQLGYRITQPIFEEGSQPVTKVETDAREPVKGQPPAELATDVMLNKGFTQKDVDETHKAIKYTPKTDDVEYTVENDLIVDKQNKKPKLPVRTYPDGDKIIAHNAKRYRPAAAWEALGLDPPLFTNFYGSRYIPWPKLRPYGRMAGKFFCQIDDLEACRKLNEAGVKQKMDVVNRAEGLAEKKRLATRQPAAKLVQVLVLFR